MRHWSACLIPSLPMLFALGCTVQADGQHAHPGDFGLCPPSNGNFQAPRNDLDHGTAGAATQRSSSDTPPSDGSGGTSCPGPAVDRWRELLIIDRSVLSDSRARNDDPTAPWSFRRRLEEVAGTPSTAAALAASWLAQWQTVDSVSTAPGVPDAPRAAISPRPAVNDVLVCPWLRARADNGCSIDCASCRERVLDLTRAPFRLIAIVNRADLGSGDSCGRDGGEVRFVYNAIAPDTGEALPFTVIFEYKVVLPAGQDRRSWASLWRSLGRLSFGSAYNARLAEVVAQGLKGGHLAHVQTNEVALGAAAALPWEMRQFVPESDGRGGFSLVETATAHTPRLSFNGSADLTAWLSENRRAILEGDNLLRPGMLAGTAVLPTADFAWQAPGADPEVLAAFNRNTCNGCHGGRKDDTLPFRHLAAAERAGYDRGNTDASPVRVSRFLHDPGHDDELGRRASLLVSSACNACNAYPTTGSPVP